MPAIDRYHETVKRALMKDGWTIDAEQVTFITANRQVVIDIKASQRNQHEEIILVEVKGFERSPIEQLAIAIGKLQIYRFVLEELGINLKIWLAVPEVAHQGILTEKIGVNMR